MESVVLAESDVFVVFVIRLFGSTLSVLLCECLLIWNSTACVGGHSFRVDIICYLVTTSRFLRVVSDRRCPIFNLQAVNPFAISGGVPSGKSMDCRN